MKNSDVGEPPRLSFEQLAASHIVPLAKMRRTRTKLGDVRRLGKGLCREVVQRAAPGYGVNPFHTGAGAYPPGLEPEVYSHLNTREGSRPPPQNVQ